MTLMARPITTSTYRGRPPKLVSTDLRLPAVNPSNATIARITLVACVVVAAVFGTVYAIHRLSHIITLVVVALFIAIILAPSVDFLIRRAHFRRGLAVLSV